MSDPKKQFHCRACGLAVNDSERPWGKLSTCPRCLGFGLMYEDELPQNISDELYNWWHAHSFIDGVRMGPRIVTVHPSCPPPWAIPLGASDNNFRGRQDH
jgi:hypothetical protein